MTVGTCEKTVSSATESTEKDKRQEVDVENSSSEHEKSNASNSDDTINDGLYFHIVLS